LLASCLQQANYDMTGIDVKDWIAFQRFLGLPSLSLYCRSTAEVVGHRRPFGQTLGMLAERLEMMLRGTALTERGCWSTPSISAFQNVENHPWTGPKGKGCTSRRSVELMRSGRECGTVCQGSRPEVAGFAGREKRLWFKQ
jgi:hypothetical protein